ncbi:MAG: glutamate-5-semialdehyde dehydrogenase [Enterobacteriaceae bacterium]
MLQEMGKAAKEAAYELAQLSTAKKNKVLAVIADMLEAESDTILAANEQDMTAAQAAGISEAIQDRLLLTPARLAAIANDVRQVCRLQDPVGHIIDGSVMESGLNLQRRRVPVGVIGVIYEARPNVTIDVATLCLKAGNATILRGGKETCHTNAALVKVIQKALERCNLPASAVQSINSPDRELINQMLKLDRYIDMLIPRGGAGLHKLCREQSTIPVITGGIGVCHIFADRSIDCDKALAIIENAKVQRPSVCNAVETLLVHRAIAEQFLPLLAERMLGLGVTLHACPVALPLLGGTSEQVVPVQEGDYDQEWLSLDLNVLVVDGFNHAIEHIRQHSTAHTEAILTRSFSHAERFVRSIDSAAVLVNASTRFNDGGQFGLGAEVAVSTQKLHARGPMGLEALTTYKWIGYGDDLIRR